MELETLDLFKKYIEYWAVVLIWVLVAIAIVLALIAQIFNYFKIRSAYLVFGTIFLVICLFIAGSTGRVYRDT